MIALVYMRIFLKESVRMRQPLLKEGEEEPCIEQGEDDSSSARTFKKLPSLGDLICLLKCRYVWQCRNASCRFEGINPFLTKPLFLATYYHQL